MTRADFYLYGQGLPVAGAWYSAPVSRRNAISRQHVLAAFRDAQRRYPRKGRVSMYHDRWVDASMKAPPSIQPLPIEEVQS